ncbi:MAG TPA: NUDIX domain-containing protein [Phycisphaerales bacterium]|nr:NUDIX domain-containing protein [Phycisphaerales bacterium]
MDPNWLDWAKRLQAVAQNGLTFTENHFDIERYAQIRQIAAEMLADKTGVKTQDVLDLFVREKDYATPKVDVRGAAFREGRILLVKECSDGKWALPGGWADVGESPSESVEREVWEESGFTVKAERLAAVYDRSKHPHRPLMHYHVYKLFCICEITGGEPTTSNETEEVAFFDESSLPELSITKILPEQIAQMFEYYRRAGLPVYFD